MNKKENNIKNNEVQKLNLYDFYDYLLNSNKETQINTLKFLTNELILTNITQAKEILGISYNGVKNHRETITIGKTKFAILKK